MIRPLILTLCAGCFCLAPGEEPEDPAVEVGEQHYRIYTRAGEPASLDQLSQISGVGDRKLEAYGELLLALVGAEAPA